MPLDTSIMSDTYCILPFVGVYHETDGVLAPCCRYNYKADSQHFGLDDFDEWWNTHLTPLREQLLAGQRASLCSKCWHDEDAGIESFRQQSNKRLIPRLRRREQPLLGPVSQMWALNNLCNLRCSFCSPGKSSTIYATWTRNRDIYRLHFDQDWQGHKNLPEMTDLARNKFLQLIFYAAEIQLTGGEPTMIPEYMEALESIPNPGRVHLSITTNGTKITQKWIDLLQKFMTCEVHISLEGISEFNDYIRAPSDWMEIDTNVTKLLDSGITVRVAHAWSRFSLKSLPSLLRWCYSKDISISFTDLTWPEPLSIIGSCAQQRQQFFRQINLWLEHDPRFQSWVNSSCLGLGPRLKQLKNMDHDTDIDAQFQTWIQGLDQLNGRTWDSIGIDDQT